MEKTSDKINITFSAIAAVWAIVFLIHYHNNHTMSAVG